MPELTISKQFEFSASHRYNRSEWSPEKNMDVFGQNNASEYGHGHNYTAYFSFSGPLQSNTGMVVNFYDIKSAIQDPLKDRYDHKFLNKDTLPFDQSIPTPENIANMLLEDCKKWFTHHQATLISCHLIESNEIEATAYINGTTEKSVWISTNLSVIHPEDSAIILRSPIHIKLTFTDKIDPETGQIYSTTEAKTTLIELLEKINYTQPQYTAEPNHSIPILFAKDLFELIKEKLPVSRIRIQEINQSFIECHKNGTITEGVTGTFFAAHRLFNPELSEQKNIELFGRCHSLHGHQYGVELTIKARNNRNLQLYDRFLNTLRVWNYKSLDQETDDFKNTISTAEHISQILWDKLQEIFNGKVTRIRTTETPENKVTIRACKLC